MKIINMFFVSFKKTIGFLLRLCRRPNQNQYFTSWFADNGDKTLRLDYNLDESSIVFDLGGYKGQWTSDIFSKYCCQVYVFEPVEAFAARIEKRFAKNNKIQVCKLGLSNRTETAPIFLDNDLTSVYREGKESHHIKLVKAADFFEDHKIHHIDLMKINIEGGEYDLLEHFIETGIVKSIRNLQIQFHDFVPDAENRMIKIQSQLGSTHRITYQYKFVWENWERNDSC